MKRLTTLLVSAALLAGSAFSAAAETRHRTIFDVKFAGLPVGKATFDIRFDEAGYALDLSGKTVGVADLFAPGSGKAASEGRFVGDRIQADRHSVLFIEKKKKPATLEMTFDNGAVATLKLDPDKRKKKIAPKYVEITPDQLSAVVDPASGIVVPVAMEKANDPGSVCNRVINIYDGDTRYDIALRYKDTRKVETDGYKGYAYVCQLRYRPVAGHKKNQKNVEYMAGNKLMEIWLAPMEGKNVYSPIRIEVPTWLGRVIAEPVFFGVADG